MYMVIIQHTPSLEKLTSAFVEMIESSDNYWRTLAAAIEYSGDPAPVLLGSNVYLRVAEIIHKRELHPSLDFDYATSTLRGKVPAGWTLRKNRAQLPKLILGTVPEHITADQCKDYCEEHGLLVADVAMIKDFYQIEHWQREPTLGDFLEHNITDVSAIAYLPSERKLVDAGAIDAILHKQVQAKDYLVLKNLCRMKGVSVPAYLRDKNRQLGFSPL
jgi:hypothetical protein